MSLNHSARILFSSLENAGSTAAAAVVEKMTRSEPAGELGCFNHCNHVPYIAVAAWFRLSIVGARSLLLACTGNIIRPTSSCVASAYGADVTGAAALGCISRSGAKLVVRNE